MYTLLPVDMVVTPETLDEVKVNKVIARGLSPSLTVIKSDPQSSMSMTYKLFSREHNITVFWSCIIIFNIFENILQMKTI